MARKLLKRVLPDRQWIKNQSALHMLGDWIHSPNLWHLNRYSVARAAFIGLFIAWLPIPLQTPIAAFCALVFQANLPISIILLWVSNPITMVPLYYMAYKVGSAVLSIPPQSFHFELSWDWLVNNLTTQFAWPLLLGCLLSGLFFGLLGSATVRVLWRWHIVHHWRKRQRRRNNNDSG